MKEWQKWKKMISQFPRHPGLSSWVLATAAIGLKTKEKFKRVYHFDHIVC